MRGSVRKPDIAFLAGLAAALLFVAPAAAQTTAPSEGATPTPAVTGDGGAVPALESPAIGPLGGRDTSVVARSIPGGTLPGFVTTAPGLGVAGIMTPFDLGNRSYGIRPSIGVDVLGTNNVFQTSSDARSDIITTIAPTLEAAISTTRLVGSLRYTPALRLYAVNSNQDGVDQVGDGQLLAALVPGLFYLNLRGAASVLAATAGQIPGSGQVVAGRNSMQTFTAQVTPFLVHRFGSAASMQLGYSFQYSLQDWADFNNSSPDSLAANYSAHRAFAVVRSGEDFGRLALQARLDGTWYVGNGIYSGARRIVTPLEARYAILPSVAVLGEIGYEKQEYAGTNPISISEATWSAGLRLTPSPDSIVLVRYGRHDGFNSLSVNAGVVLGGRTDLFATYKETIGTSLSQAQDLLATTTTDALGNTVDGQSGAPVVLINPFLGLSDTLYRMRIGTLSLRHRWPRDAFTLSGTWQNQDPISSGSTAVPISSSRGAYASFSWAHEFSPRTTGVAAVQYGRLSSGQSGQGDQNIYTAGATLMHQLTNNLSANLQAAWIRNAASEPDQGYTQSLIRAGLRRYF